MVLQIYAATKRWLFPPACGPLVRAPVSAQAQTLFNNSIEGLCRAGVA